MTLSRVQSYSGAEPGAARFRGGGGSFSLVRDDSWENVRPYTPRLRFFFFLSEDLSTHTNSTL